MDSRRYAAYRRAVELLQGPDAMRLSTEQQEVVRDHSEEISQSAAFLLRHPTAVGLVSRGLVAEVDRALLACAPSSAMAPETRSAPSARRSPSANDSNAL